MLLFSYGTLRQRDVQLATFGRTLEGSDDAIVGFALSQVAITDPDVVAKSGSSVHPILRKTGDQGAETAGMVFVISAEELAMADAYETSDYVRVEAVLKSGRRAFAYVAPDGEP